MAFIDKFTGIKEAAGISLHLLNEGNIHLNACQVIVNGSELSFGKKIKGASDIRELQKKFPAKLPLSINFSGKGVLYKQIPKVDAIHSGNFALILPGAAINDFYVQHFVSGESSFIAAIRNTEADTWIKRITELGFHPLMISLGPFPVNQILAQLNNYEKEFIFAGNAITLNDEGHWLRFHPDESAVARFTLKIDNEVIDQHLLTPYATVFQLILETRLDLIHAPVPELEYKRKESREEKDFQVKGLIILFTFLILLLVNLGIFSWLRDVNAKLTEQVSSTTSSSSEEQILSERIKEKERLLSSLGWEAGADKSLYIGQLAALLPDGVSWKEVSADPVDPVSGRSQNNLIFLKRTIEVKGYAARILDVNEWIARIKSKKWVKSALLDHYTFDTDLNTGLFTIIINY